MSSYSSNGSETTSWVKDAQDLQKTIPLVAVLGILYLMGKLLLGWVRHKQRLEQIQEEYDSSVPFPYTESSHEDIAQTF